MPEMENQAGSENPYASPTTPESDRGAGDEVVWGEKSVTFAYRQSVEDYVAAQRYLDRHQNPRERGMRRSHVLWLLFVALVMSVLLLVAPPGSPLAGRIGGWVVMCSFAAIVVLVVGLVIFLVIGRFSGGISRLASSDPDEFLCEVRVTIDPCGLKTATANVDLLRRWSSFDEAAETEDHLFLVRRSLVLNTIPKHAFTTSDEAERVLQLIRSFLEPAGTLHNNEP